MITLVDSIYVWMIFWITYWVSGIVLTFRTYYDGSRTVSNIAGVMITLLQNMVWTLLGTIVIFMSPIRAFTDYNILVKFIVCNVVAEIWFYHFHVFAHHPQLYKKLHKKHHEFTSPYALTALYCTGYEAVVINVFAVGLGPVMVEMDLIYLYVWFILVALNSTITHSGYTLGKLINGSHDIHHVKFQTNYGTLGIMDHLYGTSMDTRS